MGDPLRVAVVGYGLAGSVFHAPLVAATPGLRLVSIVTGNPGRQAAARARYPEVEVLARPADLWSRAAAHDLAVLATPTGTHVRVGLEAVDAGVNLVVDKPLAVSAPEAEVLAAAARARGLFLSAFHNRRWDGDTLTLRRLLEAGSLGRVTRFESRFERWRPAPTGGWRDRLSPGDGGGVLLDLGCHVVDQALHLHGPARHVYAEVRQLRPGVDADDDVFIALDHASGVRSHLWASAVAAVEGHRVRMLGLEGGYAKFGLDVQEEALRAGLTPGAPGWGVEPEGSWGTLVTGSASRTLETEPGCWQRYYELTRDALRDGGPPPVTVEDALSVMRVLDAARESATTGQVVEPLPV